MLRQRPCSRPSCGEAAVATLTYVYADSTAVLGPLATLAEPHCYDLCERHASKLTAPRGWDMVRLQPNPEALKPSTSELEALADLVRGVGAPGDPAPATSAGTRGHLRLLPSV
ncbi:MAG: DUF3499 domain-containing protein [Candidatus Nanopelagicales bacterium]